MGKTERDALRKLAEAVRDATTHDEFVLAQTNLDDLLTSRKVIELLDALEAQAQRITELEKTNEHNSAAKDAAIALFNESCKELEIASALPKAKLSNSAPVAPANVNELVEALKATLYSLQVPCVSCQKGIVSVCKCRKCVIDRGDTALANAKRDAKQLTPEQIAPEYKTITTELKFEGKE